MNNNDILFTPYALTSLHTLKNRIVMAPLTRAKASDDHTPTEAMMHYYARRADAGLIISEATIIHAKALGYSNTPGMFLSKHIDAWRRVTDAVHANNGYMFSQLWHVG